MENPVASVAGSMALDKPIRFGIPHRGVRFEWPDSVWPNLAIAGIVGFLYALHLLGPHVLDPRNISWLHGDTQTYYIGWALFRQDPHLHWPITFTDRIGYPIGDSISMMDVNPLLAVLLKLLSPLLPDPFQYLGLEAILACALQFFFAVRLFRLVLGRNPLAVVLPSLFFLLSPPMALRMSGHYALTNQWVLTAALFVFCSAHCKFSVSIRRFVTMTLILAAVSVAINPYLAFQVLFVLTAAVIGLAWRKRIMLLPAAAVMGALVMTAITSAYFFGFIVPGDQGYRAAGYRSYSMNLLSPLDPNGYGSLLLAQLPHFSQDQYEGYCYLGPGVIFLAIVVVLLLLLRRPKMPRLPWRAAIPLLLCCSVLTLMALSTAITAGSKLVVDLDPSQKLTPYLSILRCSGRLFWAPYYVLLLAILVAPFLFLNRRWASVLVAVALAIQLADLIPLQHWLHSGVDRPTKTALKSPIWLRLGSTYKNLMVMPPWQCGRGASPGGSTGFATFGMLAAAEKMRTNSYYSGRPIDHGYHCGEAISALTERPLSPASVYVMTPALAARITSAGTGKCHNLDRFVLCSATDDFGLGPAVWEPRSEVWIRDRFKTILGRNPTKAEEAKWAKALDQEARTPVSLIDGLLTSSEFEHNRLPQFWAYLDAQGRWPTRAEWLKNASAKPLSGAGVHRAGTHTLRDRNRAIVYILYFAVLERDPDSAGLALWSGILAQTSLQNVTSQFLNSSEYQSHEDLQYR